MTMVAPAQESIVYEVRRFNPVLHQNDSGSEYKGQSDAVDARWDALLEYGISRITEEEAKKMVELSAPIPGDEDHVIMSLAIFHEIHCLNALRKMLHPEYYRPSPPELTPTPEEHADHCIDWIRQTLMCSVDINPMVYEWEEEKQVAIPKLSALHLCRSFDAVNEWAKNHRMVREFDNLPHIQLRL
ncbi:uncharacterized protein LAESUDRAFT_688551 [Laetiporus sulphureus 93-53]|uniref:Uncharacterized protein n=1 Tax=Laetiporus sulphureus 93-53 TaxID=1314785 RepID=A0A165B2K7_9APHY|nr:uncharacterized protein LAESUDRAFT_688551 [Laetiporus sulphureus 93-53]KZT00105.1 hypothetical protein LAESUDRAFT_688551 [Laetiporus sulphureus 93-53]